MASANAARSSTPFAGIAPASTQIKSPILGAALCCGAHALALIQIQRSRRD
jgi:hypothetical protein